MQSSAARYKPARAFLLWAFDATLAVRFDPDFILASIELWRQSVDLKIEMKDQLKIHMMENRRSILDGFVHTAGMWLSMLGAMQPVDVGAEIEWNAVRAEVDDFAAWADSELRELDGLTGEE